MHRTTTRFWKCLEQLPEPVQRISKKNFDLLKADPRHPSLHFKKVGKLWSVRAGMNHRALGVKDGNDFIWVWTGTHDDYERMLREFG